MSAMEGETLCLEAQVFLKHKKIFEASEDCSRILIDLCKCGLISEDVARNIKRIGGSKCKQNK